MSVAYMEKLIRDYGSEYERANGRAPPLVKYEGGWFRFKEFGNKGYRRKALEEMIKVLRERPTPMPPTNSPEQDRTLRLQSQAGINQSLSESAPGEGAHLSPIPPADRGAE